MKEMVKHAIAEIKAVVHYIANAWSLKLFIKPKFKPAMIPTSYLLKFTSVLARQKLSPGTRTRQCNSETGHTKMISNFRNTFGV